MHAKPEFGGETKHRMVADVVWDFFVTLLLIADVDEPMIHAHFELSRGLVAPSLIFVELFETLQGCATDR